MEDRVGQRFGDYHLIRLLGRSRLAEVYLGQHLRRATQQVVVKILVTHFNETDIRALGPEAEAIASLVHPHIVRVLDFDVTESHPSFVMDYAPNGSLRQRHSPGEQVDLSTAMMYVQQVAAGLQYAHDQNYMHSYIKPDNMLIGKHGEILLSDFGIATIAHHAASQSSQVDISSIPYIAPEQMLGQPQPASDQYALAVAVYEWLAGERPFSGSLTEIAAKHAMMPPPPLRAKRPTLSPEIEQVVLTALTKDPNTRFSSVQAFATALHTASPLSAQAKISSTALLAQPPESPATPVNSTNRGVDGTKTINAPPPFRRRFVRVAQIVAWLAFLVLILAICWNPGIVVQFTGIIVQFIGGAIFSPDYGPPVRVAAVLVGFVFLLTRKHAFIGNGTLTIIDKLKQLAVQLQSPKTLLQAGRMFAVHAARIVAWPAFLVLTLAICWRTETFMQFIGSPPSSPDYAPLALGIASVGAILIGLVFLLTRKHAVIDIIEGSALTIFGSLVSLTFLNWVVAACFSGFGVPLLLSCSPFQNPFTLHPIQNSFISYQSLLLFMSILMLAMGTYFFLRSAHALGGCILAALLLLEALLQWRLLYPPQSYLADAAPVIWFWLPPTLLGVTAISVSLLKIWHQTRPERRSIGSSTTNDKIR